MRGIYLDDDIRNTTPGISVQKSSSADLEMLQNDKLKFLHNPLITYLNINNLKNNVINLVTFLQLNNQLETFKIFKMFRYSLKYIINL